ncbi:MAG: outer membrane beta-barrel protein, partial [Alistipes sp.]|nr:outer membrane beta-barrel protein [Alistipes sp.]
QPETDEVTSHHKYIVGGNVNFFQGSSRISLLGLFNNINQQNFSFEDILGVSGGGGGGGRGVGQYMVRPQNGVASVNALGLNYSDAWGKKDQVKFQGSYFFNNTRTKNLSRSEKWDEAMDMGNDIFTPVDTLYRSGYSNTPNNNHRLNARLDWTISENHSLMSRTGFSYQDNSPYSRSTGYQFGTSGLRYNEDYGSTKSKGWNFNEFLQYRVRLGKAGRTMTVDGSFRYSDNSSRRNISSNNADPLEYGSEDYDDYREQLGQDGRGNIPDVTDSPLYDPIFQYITAPSRTYNVRGSVMYNEPLGKYFQLSISYRLGYQNSNRDQQGFYTDNNFKIDRPNPEMTNAYQSGYWTHNVGPGIRYSKDKNTFVANVSYQRSSLSGSVMGGQSTEIKKNFNNVLYFAMANYAFNRENTIRLFFRSSTNAPSVGQLQDIYDVSTPQYLSVGNKDLNPAFNHSINFHYINSNVEKGRTFMWMFMMNHQQNYISSSTWYNRNGVTDVDVNGVTYHPQRVTSYENMDGYWFLRTHVSLGLPLSFMKCNLNIMAGVNYNIVPSAIYESFEKMQQHIFTTNKAKNIGYDLNVTLGSNISENIDFTLSWSGGYNQAWNTAAQNGSGKNNYFNHTASGALKWVFWKGFTFTANCSYVQYIGFTNDYNESYVLCNLYLGKKIFKNQLGEIQVGVNDVANQNTAFARSTGSGYTQNSWNSVIGRYYSVQFVYNLRHFGKKGSTSTKDYDYNESSGAVGMGRSGGQRPMGPPPGMR